MEKEMVIYRKGETCIQTTVKNGICEFTSALTVKEYLEKLGPDYVCISWDEALRQIQQNQEKIYLTPWEEISQDKWSEAFHILPPQKYRVVAGVEIFRMMERATDNITVHYAKIENRCFKTHRKTTDNYSQIANEVWEAFINLKTQED